MAEWQTRWLQVPVSFGTWGFKSPFAHRMNTPRSWDLRIPTVRGVLHFRGANKAVVMRLVSDREWVVLGVAIKLNLQIVGDLLRKWSAEEVGDEGDGHIYTRGNTG